MKFEKNNPYAKLGGRPTGIRNRLSARVRQDMLEGGEEISTPPTRDSTATAGRAALRTMRRERPAEFVKAYVALVPKELQVESWSHDMSEDDLVRLIERFREAEERAIDEPSEVTQDAVH